MIAQKIGLDTSIVSRNDNCHSRVLLNLCYHKFPITKRTDPILESSVGLVVEFHEQGLMESLYYFLDKLTRELQHFNWKENYIKISSEKEGIRCYSRTISSSQKFENNCGLNRSKACIDLISSTFYERCPLAYTLIKKVHWHDPDERHSRNETFIRHLLKIYVVEGSTLDLLFRKNCTRCRFLHQKET